MPGHMEYKFVTTKLSGLVPKAGEHYFNWADVSEMLSRYGADGWTVRQMNSTRLGDDSVVYAFVLERALPAPLPRRTR